MFIIPHLLKNGAVDQVPVLPHAGVEVGAVALVVQVLGEARRDHADDHRALALPDHEWAAVVVLEPLQFALKLFIPFLNRQL